ncbi:MAG: imidazoleglycerol-phosphate dehydratase HisB [Balneolaceae bacterium]
MKIWIDNNALSGRSDELLWPGALYGLKRLLETGYELSANPDKLTENQLQLLDNELIRFSSFKNSEAGAVILRNDKQGNLNLLVDGEPAAEGYNWIELTRNFLYPNRKASKVRKTSETDIQLSLNIDGEGKGNIRTGLKFLDHMLEQIAKHGLIDLDIQCDGDLEVDEHHTIEDVAITLGETLYEACGHDKTGIQRYGFLLAMDESQAEVAIDLSNRPYLVWKVEFNREYVGDFPLEMAEHFFYTLAMHLQATLHIRVEGKNDHHKLESIFKGFAKALRFAVTRTERTRGILPSSKGTL